jgi:hypothetical protein
MAAALRPQRLADPIGWRDQLAACFRRIERRRLDKTLAGAAIVSARSDDANHEYVEHYRNVAGFLAHFETVCVISRGEASEMRKTWVRTEAELRIRRLPLEQRRALLLDPQDGPQRFLTLKRRARMLHEIDDELRWGRRPNAAGGNS